MKTETLIEQLAKDLEPVRRGAIERALGWALLGGVVFSLAFLMAWLGLRPMDVALTAGSFWMKALYTLTLAGSGWLMTRRVARPGGRLGRTPYITGAVFGGLVLAGGAQVALAEPATHAALLLGDSWSVCPLRIVVLSTPILVGLMLTMRTLAPTRRMLAGATAGLLAGGLGASLYGLHCPETSAAFVAVWYSLGIAVTALLGALAGPRLLRW